MTDRANDHFEKANRQINAETLGVIVLAPTGVNMELQYIRDIPSTVKGLCLVTHLRPTNVSFYNVEIIEDTCPATDATGIYQTFNHPRWYSGWASVSQGNITKGCLVKGPNSPDSDNVLPYD
jgi:hypothetical protein